MSRYNYFTQIRSIKAQKNSTGEIDFEYKFNADYKQPTVTPSVV